MEYTGGGDRPLGPIDPLKVPRFAGPGTFVRLPRLDEVTACDVAILGVPSDSGVTYRPGARFGPMGMRAGSRLIRGYHGPLDFEPFLAQQVADAGDIGVNPFDLMEAIAQIEAAGPQASRGSTATTRRRARCAGCAARAIRSGRCWWHATSRRSRAMATGSACRSAAAGARS